MNKTQVNKRAKRNQVSKQKKKQRNVQKIKRQKAESQRKNKLMQFFTNLSKTKQKEVLKNINKDGE
jgi:acetolactate synthase small subunit